jgi:FkbM family methyltransferase
MPILKYRKRTLAPLSNLISEITYVMCGARGETTNRLMRALPQVRFIGFEPATEEFKKLKENAADRFSYINAAVGARNERRCFYETQNPGCSSLLQPNQALYSRFENGDRDLAVVEEREIATVALDSCLPAAGIQTMDILELDTQGSELEILHGAENLLSKTTVVVKCEVEFSPLYLDQPLFGDVDAFLRNLGFMLFDLSRTRYRRSNFPPDDLTRGQLLWGDALYLRDAAWFTTQSDKLSLFKLSLVAAHLQFHDYALEIIDLLLNEPAVVLSPEERTSLLAARQRYLQDLARGANWIRALRGLEAVGLGRPIKAVGRLATQLGERLRKDRLMAEYNWVD